MYLVRRLKFMGNISFSFKEGEKRGKEGKGGVGKWRKRIEWDKTMGYK